MVVVLTTAELAAALTNNSHTEAEARGDRMVLLTVRPQHSSQTFTALVRVESMKEV